MGGKCPEHGPDACTCFFSSNVASEITANMGEIALQEELRQGAPVMLAAKDAYHQFSVEALRKRIRELEGVLDNYRHQVVPQNAKLILRVTELEAELEQATGERNSFESRLNLRRKERDEARKELAACEATNAVERAKRKDAGAELERVKREKDRLYSEACALMEERDKARVARDTLATAAKTAIATIAGQPIAFAESIESLAESLVEHVREAREDIETQCDERLAMEKDRNEAVARADEWQGLISSICDSVDVPSECLQDWCESLRKRLLEAEARAERRQRDCEALVRQFKEAEARAASEAHDRDVWRASAHAHAKQLDRAMDLLERAAAQWSRVSFLKDTSEAQEILADHEALKKEIEG